MKENNIRRLLGAAKKMQKAFQCSADMVRGRKEGTSWARKGNRVMDSSEKAELGPAVSFGTSWAPVGLLWSWG